MSDLVWRTVQHYIGFGVRLGTPWKDDVISKGNANLTAIATSITSTVRSRMRTGTSDPIGVTIMHRTLYPSEFDNTFLNARHLARAIWFLYENARTKHANVKAIVARTTYDHVTKNHCIIATAELVNIA